MEAPFDYSHWTEAELAAAEQTANRFLNDQHPAITKILGRQCNILQRLVQMLEDGNLAPEQRLDCMARIAEVAQAVDECASGFFDLGTQPVVARLLADTQG